MEQKPYANIKIGKPKNSELEIEGEIPVEVLEKYKKKVLEDLKKDFESPGFRKGQVPENILLGQIDGMKLLEEAAEGSLNEAYPAILNDEKLETLGRPHVIITKLAPGSPLGFKIRVGLIPKIKLPDYVKIGKKISSEKGSLSGGKETEVTDAEVEQAVDDIVKLRAKNGEKENQTPELTDEFVKTLGKFENVADFKARLKENIRLEKKAELKRKLREKIAEKLLEETKIEMPEVVIEDEVAAMHSRRHEEVGKMGIKMEDYLKHLGKTEEEIAKEEAAYAERQFKTRLILEKIAETEKIVPSENSIEEEMAALISRFPDANPAQVRSYVESMLMNEKVLEFLETGEK